MRKYSILLVLLMVFILSGCAETTASGNNFVERRDTYLITQDKSAIVYYKTDNDGKMVEIDVDRLLTIEEMILLNPNINFNFELEGFDGDIFIEPRNTCTQLSNDVLVPVNIEVGNTRYKFDNTTCLYKTVDKYNEYKAGHADEYLLTDTIAVAEHVTISITVYNPSELVSFIEIYEIPNTYKTLGVNNILINFERDGYENPLANYYRDVTVFEQIYIKHQGLEACLSEISGIATDINLMDIDSLTEINPLIDNFEALYEIEISAIEELQDEIGLGFSDTTTEADSDTEPEE